MKVTRVERGLFWDTVVFKAKKYEEACFGTFLGDKTFYVEEGEKVRLRMSKSDCFEVGDKVKLEYLITMTNQNKFSWYWG